MPIIEELSDEDSRPEPAAPDREQASRALNECIKTVRDSSRPVDARYCEVLSKTQPILDYYSQKPPPPLDDLALSLSELLRPSPDLAPPDYFIDEETETANSGVCARALSALHLLSEQLLSLLLPLNFTPTADLAVLFASYTSLDDAWTTRTAQSLAIALLQKHHGTFSSRPILVEGILAQTIRPLFRSPTQSTSRITPSARLALRRSRKRGDDVETPPWRAQLPSSIATLEWSLSSLPSEGLEAAWPLLIPPILTLNDSTYVFARRRAIGMITALLGKLGDANSPLLERTGLGSVFWDAVLPALSWLPPLTPSEESVPLLSTGFECLKVLAMQREKKGGAKRAKLLDVVVREGFEKGVMYAGEYAPVVETLVGELEGLVELMGVHFVRHLKSITAALSNILADPLGNTRPTLLVKALRTEQAIARTCWPRVDLHVPELMRGVAVCWGRVRDDEAAGMGKPEFREIEKEARSLVAILKAIVESTEEGKERWAKLETGVCQADENGCFTGLFRQE